MCVHSKGAAECIVSLTGAIAGVVRAQRLGDLGMGYTRVKEQRFHLLGGLFTAFA